MISELSEDTTGKAIAKFGKRHGDNQDTSASYYKIEQNYHLKKFLCHIQFSS